MTKITFLGDSIRMQYAPVVQNLLGEGFESFSSGDNGRYSKYTMRCIYDHAGDMEGSDIVHWNNGLWDVGDIFGDGLFTPLEEYTDNMLRIADQLLKKYKVVIFATTTPLKVGHCHARAENVVRYNEALVPLLKERGVIINDLFSLVAADIDRYICEDRIHLSDEGVALCANAVAEVIRKAAEGLAGA